MSKLTVHMATATLNRRETLEGREYLVAPVIAVREGVLNGELATAEDIGKYVDTWNGIPLPVGHPEQNGVPVSANTPQILENQTVGRFWNASFNGNALRGEIWVEVNKAQSLGGEALTALEKLENGEPLEVSTAYFNDIEPTSGTYNGITYNGIQRNLRPDHLALLPNTVGACNWEDGCGAPRVNHKKKEGGKGSNMFKKMKNMMGNLLSANQEEVSFGETGDLLEQAMIQETGDAMRFLIREVFDDYFIYQESTANGFDGRLMKRGYEIDENKKVTLGTPEEVKKVVTYEPVTPSTNKQQGKQQTGSPNPGQGQQTKPSTNEGETHMDKKAFVSGLITNESNQFTENDRTFLEGLEEEQLKKMQSDQQPSANENKGDCGCKGTPSVNNQQQQTKKEEGPSTNKEKTMEQWIQDIPDPETREFIVNSRKKQQEHRDGLVQKLSANERCAFGEEDLKGMSTNQLEKLNKSIQVEDYSGMGGPSANYNQNSDEIPAAPSVVMASNEEGGNQ